MASFGFLGGSKFVVETKICCYFLWNFLVFCIDREEITEEEEIGRINFKKERTIFANLVVIPHSRFSRLKSMNLGPQTGALTQGTTIKRRILHKRVFRNLK